MTEHLLELLEELPELLGGHLSLSLAALAVGLAISLPLGIAASRRPKFSETALGVAGVIQTVPSLALLALMVPLLGGLIGFVPAFLALVLYSILPILANTIIGIKGVDPVLTEAALGLGMSRRQMLFQVQLPLAAPVIIAGIRTGTVLVVGTATLATPVGETTLGNYIFQGLETRNHLSTVLGCLLAAALAVVLDQLIRLLERAAEKRDRTLAWVAVAGLAVVLLGGLYKPITRLLGWQANRAVIASGPFTEQHILSRVLATQLQTKGFAPYRRPGMGETIQFEALRRSHVDCCVDYSGSIWAILMKRSDVAEHDVMMREIYDYLLREHGIECLGSLGFEDAYALAMPRRQAERLNLKTVADLAAHIDREARAHRQVRIGGDHQIFGRPEWRRLKEKYGLNEKGLETIAMDPTLMYQAVSHGSVDVITAYTSDGRIKAEDLVILEDNLKAFPPYDALLLLSPKARTRPGLKEALEPLVGKISLDAMQDANKRVDVERWTVRRAAAELYDKVSRTQ